MVVDTSALVAMLFGEPEKQLFADLILQAPIAVVAAASVVETSMVITGRRAIDDARLDALLDELKIGVRNLGPEQIAAARDAFRRYGKGRHPAALNFGDCFSYALAKVRDDALLFKGDDFSRTDILPAWRP